jgi:hypothetical protein
MTPEDHLKEARRIRARYEDFDNSVKKEIEEETGFDITAAPWEYTASIKSAVMQVAQLEALLAIAGFLEQFPICGHGSRGFCPHCFMVMKEGGQPQ